MQLDADRLRRDGWNGSAQALEEGWDIFHTDRDDGVAYELCRVDEMGVFADDTDAWRHVYAKAQVGSNLHLLALEVLQVLNPEEFAAIVKHCAN
jgi:hypothetical protein